jgi:3-oxoacyl-[acyl-carrier-protein] synthase-3
MMQGLRIAATGAAVPAKSVTNDDFARVLDTSDTWIYERTGIHSRYFCEEETCVSLAIAAARQALERSGLSPADISCCIAATISGDYATPSVSCMVQAELGLSEDIPVMDVNAACTGFLYALETARGLLNACAESDMCSEATGYSAGDAKRCSGRRYYGLVIGCEQLSRILDMEDRSTCVLFGDGAGAAIVELTSETPYASVLGARGGKEILALGAGSQRSVITMDGKAVFRFAVEAMPAAMKKVLDKAGMTLDEIDQVICHQANSRIIDFAVRRMHADPQKFYKDMDHFGNTSAASIPLALNEAIEAGVIGRGQNVMLVGFGSGLTWGAAILRV